MSEIAQKAVLMPSISFTDSSKKNGHCNKTKQNFEEEEYSTQMVHGPVTTQNSEKLTYSAEQLMRSYKYIGFQATQYGRAVDIANSMIVKQPESIQYVIHDGEFVDVNDVNNTSVNVKDDAKAEAENINNDLSTCASNDNNATHTCKKLKLIYPSIFLGITANLIGTGCREAIRFLVKYGVRPRCTRCKAAEKKLKSKKFCNTLKGEKQESEKQESSEEKRLRRELQCTRNAVQEEQTKSDEVIPTEKCSSEELLLSNDSNNNADDDDDNNSDSDSDEFTNENDAVLPIEPAWLTSHTSEFSEAQAAHKISESKSNDTLENREANELPYKSFIDVLVVSGGAIEHDLRRACQPYYLNQYANDECNMASNEADNKDEKTTSHNSNRIQFGNVTYEQTECYKGRIYSSAPYELFDVLMTLIARRLKKTQDRIRANALATKNNKQCEPPICPWTITPSQVWRLIGLWLVELLSYALAIVSWRKKQELHNKNARDVPCININNDNHDFGDNNIHCEKQHTRPFTETEQTRVKTNNKYAYLSDVCDLYDCYCNEEKVKVKCSSEYDALQFVNEAQERVETTVVYWAAHQEVPIFSPSFVDGDIMHYLYNINNSNNGHCAEKSRNTSSKSMDGDVKKFENVPFQIDLVQDIHALNKFAMRRRHTAMLICGGGVVKHHICNANLMRNGADKAIFLNNGSEFDGSDAGARPEEALSWGKIRIDGRYVKVYGEVTTTLPLLVAQVFVPAARKALQRHNSH